MKPPKKEKHFIHKPSYPGGPKALWKFIRSNLRYPKEAMEHNISGVVRLRYTINSKGQVVETQVMHSLGYGCDEEAIRVISMLKYDVPKHRKMKVKFHKNINIKFKPPKKPSLKITYSQKKQEEKEKPAMDKKEGYGYTITFNK
jgi:protein TonB